MLSSLKLFGQKSGSSLKILGWIVLLAGFTMISETTQAQSAILGFEIEGSECGGEVFGAPGEIVEVEAFVTIETPDEGASGWSFGLSGEGANITFTDTAFVGCNSNCASELIGQTVFINAAQTVDPELDPISGPLNGGPQGDGVVGSLLLDPPSGTLPTGSTRVLKITFEVTVPQGQEGEGVRLFFTEGLQGDGQPVFNKVSFNSDTTVSSVTTENGLTLNECMLTVNAQAFKRGDANVDGTFDLTDPIITLEVLFLGKGEFLCPDAADSNDDGEVDISDTINSLTYQFLSGTVPAPGPDVCGKDPTEDTLAECVYENC